MLFTGKDILGDDASSVKVLDTTTSVSIKNGVYDNIFLSSDPNNYKDDNMEWNDSTLIWATFDDRALNGGNIGSLGNQLYSMKLKRREVGRSNWVDLAGYIITDTDNLNFLYVDKYARGRSTEYEYAVTYVLKDGTELPYVSSTVISEFCGAILADSETSYHVFLDPSLTSVTRNRQTNVVTTLNSKYPFIFIGGNSNYDSGTFSGTMIKNCDNDDWDLDGSYRYREEMVDWLTNGEPKILKMEDGREWLMNVNGDITIDNSEHVDKVSISFDFVQIGDYDNSDDLANNELTSYDSSDYGVYYTVRFNLNNISSYNSVVSIIQLSSYKNTLKPYDGYNFSDVVITMSGVDITSSAFNPTTGAIEIHSVSGDIEINATAEKILAKQLALSSTSLVLQKGDRFTLQAVYAPSGAASTVEWKSNNSNVATVTKGIVQGIAVGDTYITATIDGVSATCNISVKCVTDGMPVKNYRPGNVISLNEGTVSTDFIVAEHDYHNAGTLVVRKDLGDEIKFNESYNNYNGGTLDKWCVSYFDKLASDASKDIVAVDLTSIRGGSKSNYRSTETINRKVFSLALNELVEPKSATPEAMKTLLQSEGPRLSGAKFLKTSLSDISKWAWTRTPACYISEENSDYEKDYDRTRSYAVYYDKANPANEYSSLFSYNSTTETKDYGTITMHPRPAFVLKSDKVVKVDNPIFPINVTLSDETLELNVGDTKTLEATINPENSSFMEVNWKSNAPLVATVENGVVKALSAGTAIIYGMIGSASGKCTVTVK